jgi:hypothetical protein
MTLSIDSERWCECVVDIGPLHQRPLLCGDIAISTCGTCGIAMCESHEIFCDTCQSVTCMHCGHVCRAEAAKATNHAA